MSYADDVINGDFDCYTGEWLGNGQGFPRSFDKEYNDSIKPKKKLTDEQRKKRNLKNKLRKQRKKLKQSKEQDK